MKQLERKFGRLILFIDRAPQHYRSINVKKHLEEHHDAIRIEYFPKGSPEFNVIEECWRQGKHDLLVSKTLSTIYLPKKGYCRILQNKTIQSGYSQVSIKKYNITDVC